MPATTSPLDVSERARLLIEAEGTSRRVYELLDETYRKAAAAAELAESIVSELRTTGLIDEAHDLHHRAAVLKNSLDDVEVDDINIAAWSAHELNSKIQELREQAIRSRRENDDDV